MRTLEIFFDYECPHCERAHKELVSLIQGHPDIEIVWRPTEAHPSPEPGPHTDKLNQGLLFAIDQGVDIWAFHELMYDVARHRGVDCEDIDVLACCVSGLMSAAGYHKALESRKYEAAQKAINDLAYERSGVWAVPAYRMDGKRLDAMLGVGVTREQLASFLKGE